jgi:hypothetical protein
MSKTNWTLSMMRKSISKYDQHWAALGGRGRGEQPRPSGETWGMGGGKELKEKSRNRQSSWESVEQLAPSLVYVCSEQVMDGVNDGTWGWRAGQEPGHREAVYRTLLNLSSDLYREKNHGSVTEAKSDNFARWQLGCLSGLTDVIIELLLALGLCNNQSQKGYIGYTVLVVWRETV